MYRVFSLDAIQVSFVLIPAGGYTRAVASFGVSQHVGDATRIGGLADLLTEDTPWKKKRHTLGQPYDLDIECSERCLRSRGRDAPRSET